MSAALEPTTGIVYESIMFRGPVIEVSFTEQADRGDGVARVQTLVIDAPRKVPGQHATFMEALTDLVDAAMVALRNPPEDFRGR